MTAGRRRRKKNYVEADDPEALVPISLDVRLWLRNRLEAEADATGMSRASIACEWLELHAIATDPKRKHRRPR